MAAVLASHMPVDGVTWAGSILALPAKGMIIAAARNPLPPELLIRCLWHLSAGVPPQRFLATRTAGLGFFDLPKLRDDTGEQDTNAIRNRLLNLGSYLIASGPVIRDGDVCGSEGTNTNSAFQARHVRDNQGPLLTLNRLE